MTAKCALLAVVIDTGFSIGILPTLMDDVRCSGSEQRLIDCHHKTREGSNCDASENVGLVCGGETVEANNY